MKTKQDILSQDDVVYMVNSFYDKIKIDKLLSPIFNDFAKVDWSDHLPKMYRFWEYLIFGIPGYKGQPLPGNLKLPVTQKHFSRWLQLFTENIDERFEGHNTEYAKGKAAGVAVTFQYKIALFK